MKVKELFEEEHLFEMSNLSKNTTGLDRTIWVSVKIHSSGPRIKVNYDNSLSFNTSNNFSVSISENPRVVAGDTEENVIKKIGKNSLEDIFDWIKLNKTALEKYWNFQIDTLELLRTLKTLNP